MTQRERLLRQIRGEPVDRIPMLGGWNEGISNLCAIGGIGVEDYLRDPWAGVMQANRALHVDGMVPPIVPQTVEEIRASNLQESGFSAVEPEALLRRAEAIRNTERQVLAQLDLAAEEKKLREYFQDLLMRLGDMPLIPTLWSAPANFALYFEYGYSAFFAAIGLYPEAVRRIYWEDGVKCRARNGIVVRLFREFDLLPMLFCGHDICNSTGPMCSPAYLRKYYWPAARYSLEPFLEADIRLVCHCDGNVMPLIDDIVTAGFSGFQGFQYECGVDPYRLRQYRGPRGEEPLFFAGLSVTRTLPFGTPEEVREEVDYLLDFTEGGRGLFLFTSNVTGVDVPPGNIVAAYRYLESVVPNLRKRTAAARGPWPWRVHHPSGEIPLGRGASAQKDTAGTREQGDV